MPFATLQARVLFPSAAEVLLESEFGQHALSPVGEGYWEKVIDVPDGVFPYRYRVNRTMCLPDPYNANFTVLDGRYYSLLDSTVGQVNDFRERPLFMCHSSTVPSLGQPARAVRSFSPKTQQIVGLLFVENLHRDLNHVLWLWESPAGQTVSFENVFALGVSFFYSVLPYAQITDFGLWQTTCYLNGRLCQQITCRIAPPMYTPAGTSLPLGVSLHRTYAVQGSTTHEPTLTAESTELRSQLLQMQQELETLRKLMASRTPAIEDDPVCQGDPKGTAIQDDMKKPSSQTSEEQA